MLPLKQLVATNVGPLPLIRFILYALVAFLALGLLMLALATLIAQLVKTVGYNRVGPAITSAVTNADHPLNSPFQPCVLSDLPFPPSLRLSPSPDLRLCLSVTSARFNLRSPTPTGSRQTPSPVGTSVRARLTLRLEPTAAGKREQAAFEHARIIQQLQRIYYLFGAARVGRCELDVSSSFRRS